MRVSTRALKILTLLSVAACAVGGVSLLHKQRKASAARRAWNTGMAALRNQEYTKAAENLGRYLIVDKGNVEALLAYADAQTRRRPQTKANIEQAVSALESALRLDRGNDKASLRLIELYSSIRAPIEAERVARAWLEVAPADPVARQSLALALITQQKHDEAVRVLEETVATQPGAIAPATALAFLRLAADRTHPEKAQALLDEVVRRNPHSAAALLARVRFQLVTGRYSQARADLETAEKLGCEDDLSTQLEMAPLLFDFASYERACRVLDAAEKTFPSSPLVYVTRGQIVMEQGDTAGGASLAERILTAPLGEQRLDVLPLAVELFIFANRSAEARQCIDQLRAGNASSETVLHMEGLLAVAEGRSREGISQLKDVAKRTPRNAKIHLNLGRALLATGELRQAAAELAEYLRLDVTSTPNTSVQLQLANIYGSLGRWEDAARTAIEAERQAPYRTSAVLTSIEAQARVTRPEGPKPNAAVYEQLYERAQKLANLKPTFVRSQLLVARLASWRGEWDKVADALKGLDQQPHLQFMAAEIYSEAGRHSEAIAACNKMLEAATPEQRPPIEITLAELYAASGNVETSIRLAEQVANRVGSRPRLLNIRIARLFLAQGRQAKAGELLVNVVRTDPQDAASRLLLLSSFETPPPGGPSRQELVEQLREIQGPSGRDWRLWQARLWLIGEDWGTRRKSAEDLLKACLADDPDCAEAAALLAQTYERTGEIDQALGMCKRAFNSNPADKSLVKRYLELAARAGRWTEVNGLLDSLPQNDPSAQRYRIAQALREGNVAKAEELIKIQLKTEPNDVDARLQLADLERAHNKPGEAQRLLDEAARLAPNAPNVLAARVQFHLSRSEFGPALALCNQALSDSPLPEEYLLRAAVHEAQADLEAAERDFLEAARTGRSEEAYLLLGYMYLQAGKLELALEKWRQGLSSSPKSYALRRATTTALLAGTPEQQVAGMKVLEELLAERADDTLMLLKADHLAKTDPAEAERLYGQIIERFPGSAEAFERLIRLTSQRGEMARALELVERGLINNPRELALLFQKYQLLSSESPGRATVAAREAADVARTTLFLQPGNAEAAASLARATAITGDLPSAISQLRKFVSEGGRNQASARLALALLCIAARDFKQADEQLTTAAELLGALDARPVHVRILWHARQDQWEPIVSLARRHAAAHPGETAVVLAAARALTASPDAQYRAAALPLFELAAQSITGDPEFHAELGTAYYNCGRLTEAKSAFQRALQIQPGNLSAVNNLAWILCEHDHDPAAAEKLTRGVLTTSPAAQVPSLLDTDGVVQYRLGMQQKSRQHLLESQARLEACLNHQAAPPATRACATLHLARTLAELDRSRSRELLEELISTASSKTLLSPADQEEADRLLQQLRADGASRMKSEAHFGLSGQANGP